ncbi:MAG: transcription elongation factor subunit Spt4 [Candidatus Micrarchaeota archaeon]
MLKACRKCRYIFEGDKCSLCGSEEFSKSFEGSIYVVDPGTSQIAGAIGAKVPGKYALKIK